MNDKVTLLVNAIVNLSDSERDELLRRIGEFNKKGHFEKSRQREELNESRKRITGAVSSFTCPACGR